MIDDIETATRCSCGAPVTVGPSTGTGPDSHGMWCAVCRDCYGPVDDSGPTERVLGYGKTPYDALCAWSEAHDEAHDVTWDLVDMFGDLARQVSEESERQRLGGWVTRCAASRNPPETCPIGGELVCGPPASLDAAEAQYADL